MLKSPYYRRVPAKSQTKNSRTCSIREYSGIPVPGKDDSTSSAPPAGRSGITRSALLSLPGSALSLRSLPESLPGTLFHAVFRTVLGSLLESVLRTVLRSLLESILGALRKRPVLESLPRSLRKDPVRRELSACAGHGASPHASGALTHSTCRCGLCDSHPGRSCCCLSQNGVGRSQPGEGDPDGGDCHELPVHSCLRWFGVLV